ncbi:hypothetical protein [Hyphomicrobium sp.]|uniref:hypothetical protein n=1 Tax=Hyphomicrobium sp. TaxID=82 RepID=UPI0025C56366|nr:hypothetical protein [Hyphomicrobium sp.]MCC7252739.1 hypothetical protein [Hyphomicrobium sp.]
MRKQTLCFLVVGASLSLLLQNLARRRAAGGMPSVSPQRDAEVIDLAAWKEARRHRQVAL